MNKTKLIIEKNGLTLNDKPFYLASGDFHYFRCQRGGWKRRLQLMKDFGLTAIQTYVPWNLHEPEKGEFHFEDNLDVAAFLELCSEVGIYVMFRPGVYMCSEWDFGGMPYWLRKERDMCVRTNDPKFMVHLDAYYKRLSKEFVPYLSTNGGPIIAVAVENEYGSFADDREYTKAVGDMLKGYGVDVPLFTANGWEPMKLKNGSHREYWNGLDLHALTPQAKASIDAYQPDKPIYVGEFWGGRSQQWGGYFARQTPEEVAQKYKNLLETGSYVNFYMFCGGTTHGFQNGALVGKYGADKPDAPNRYIPFCTSYDVDAPVSEEGRATEKYKLCSRVLKNYLLENGFEEFAGNIKEAEDTYKAQKISDVKLTQSADLLDNVENISTNIRKSGKPITMEDMDQAYGFILYSTFVNYTDSQKRMLNIQGLHDRAIVFANGKYIGTCMRDRQSDPIVFDVPEDGLRVDILVESLGRVNYGTAMLSDFKGITDYVKFELLEDDGSIYPWNYTMKAGWTNYSLPLKDLSKLDYTKPAKEKRPAFFKGEFKAQPGVDTFLDMSGWNKGVVWINGFNIGRYWKIGPQGTLYVSGELLKEDNTIEVLELHDVNPELTVQFADAPSIDTIPEEVGLVESVVG